MEKAAGEKSAGELCVCGGEKSVCEMSLGENIWLNSQWVKSAWVRSIHMGKRQWAKSLWVKCLWVKSLWVIILWAKSIWVKKSVGEKWVSLWVKMG